MLLFFVGYKNGADYDEILVEGESRDEVARIIKEELSKHGTPCSFQAFAASARPPLFAAEAMIIRRRMP